jgi:hypothetical protein
MNPLSREFFYLVNRVHRAYIRQKKAREPKMVWIAQRSDGKCWAGAHKWSGRTFTHHRKFIYRWGTEESCRSAILWNDLTNVEPRQVDLAEFAKRR